MAQAKTKTIKPDPQEKPDTPLRAIDTLNSCLRRAQGIVAVIRDGAESEATQFDNGELASALAVVFDLLDEAHSQGVRLHAFRKAVAV